ncbi:MAG: DUF4065 domain-containing protein [Sphingobacteriales bacterium JAD_PAG50586_3]|nr:MAG: DUF4065 domain-containing protein [Sphingobacteriales bacterium JAD_PAG50586_3]
MKANNIAGYVISLTQNNPEENLTNLKLQKILYYLQGFHFALYKEQLFEDEIEAWKYGPVVSEVYHTYKGYGNNSIVVPDANLNFDFLNAIQKSFINKVYSYYRQFSAIKLMELTHSEEPWLATFGKEQVIPNGLMAAFFEKSELVNLFGNLSDIKKERKAAAQFLLVDYLYDKNLTELTKTDTDDIHEY